MRGWTLLKDGTFPALAQTDNSSEKLAALRSLRACLNTDHTFCERQRQRPTPHASSSLSKVTPRQTASQ